MAGEQALGAELLLRPGGQPSPDAAIAAGLPARARAGLPVLDDIQPAPLPSCLCATRSDRPDSSAKPAGREALTAAPAPAAAARLVMDRLQAVNGVAGPRRAAGSGFRSGEVGRDRVGGVAVQAVPGVVVPAGGAGVLVPGVVLHVAEGRAGVEREGDRRVPQAVRG